MPTDLSPSPGVRARVRAETTQQILDTARRHLASDGAAGLSLRAVARDLGMVSSAVYRYVPSRDALLTHLIVDAYDALGSAAEAAEARVERSDLSGRFRAIARAVRGWAVANAHEYALIYGSPVPGYEAPPLTVEPATRVPSLLIGIIQDALARGAVPDDRHDVPADVVASLAPVRQAFDRPGAPVPADLVVRGIMAWTYLFGAVSFDLFGHRHNVITDERAVEHPFFEHEVDRLLGWMGLPASLPAATPRTTGPAAPVSVVEGRAWG